MNPKWMAMIVFVWVTASFMSGIMEDAFIGEAEKGVLDNLNAFRGVGIDQPSGILSLVTAPTGFFQAVYDLLAFKVAFLDGNQYATVFRAVVLAPITVVIIYGFIMVLVGVFTRVLT